MPKSNDLYGTFGSAPDETAQGGGGQSMNVRANPDAFGAAIANATEAAGDEYTKQVTHFASLATEAKTNDDYANKYAPAAAKLREQYDMLDGQDKIHGYDGYINGLQDLNKQFTSTAGSPLGERLMSGLINRHIVGEIDGAKRELVQSQKQFAADAMASKIQADSNYAAQNYNNPQIVDQTIASNNAMITMQAIDDGHDPNTPEGQALVQQAQRSATGNVATSLITRAVNTGDINTAYELRSKYAPVIPGQQQTHLDNLLFAQSMQQVSTYAPQALMAGKPLPEVSGSPPSVIQAKVADAAHAQGVDINTALTYIRIESANGQNLGTRGTLAQDKLGGTIEEQIARLPSQIKAAEQTVSQSMGRTAEPWEGYMVHQQGTGGGIALIKAAESGDTRKAVDILKPFEEKEKGYNALSAIQGNGGNASMTAGDFLKYWKQRYADNNRRSATDLPQQYAQDSGIQTDGTPTSPGNAILKPHIDGGEAVQPAATPRQTLTNFDEKYPLMIQRANEIPNIETRQRVIKSLQSQRSVLAGASNAYTQNLVNQAMTIMTKKDFNIDRDVTPEMQSALSEDHPQTLIAMQSRSDRIAEHGTGAASKDTKENGDKFFDITKRMNLPANDPNRINDESQLLPFVNAGLTMKGWDQAKKLLGQDDVRKKFMTNGMSQITSFASNKMDTEGQRQAYAWYNYANQLIDDKLAEGKKLSDLITPGTKDYVGNSINTFREYILEHPNDMTGSPDLRSPNQVAKEQPIVGKVVENHEAKISAAKAAGYTEEEIQAYLNGKK